MPGLEPLARLLDAAEDAAPVDAVSAVTREVGLRLQATSVSFLVADTSGRALVRLTHVPLRGDSDRAGSTGEDGHRAAGEESAQLLPFDGGPLEKVVRSQHPRVLPPGQDGWTALAPVTERGEVIGVLELRLPEEPGKQDIAEITTLASELGVNIHDIEIAQSSEGAGVLLLLVDTLHGERYLGGLAARGYRATARALE